MLKAMISDTKNYIRKVPWSFWSCSFLSSPKFTVPPHLEQLTWSRMDSTVTTATITSPAFIEIGWMKIEGDDNVRWKWSSLTWSMFIDTLRVS